MGRKSLAKQRRAQIIDAFYRCIKRDGLQNASTRRIAEEAGVKPSILHHYFKDRDEMVEELVKRVVDDMTARYAAEISRYKNPKTRFNKGVEFLFGPEMISDDERARDSFTMLYRRFRDAIVNLLIETDKSARLSPAQIKELATMLVAIQDGISIQWDMDRKNVSLRKMTRMTIRLIELYIEDAGRARRAK